MIIIPDIHGRIFWKDAVKSAKEDEKIVFLGDYLDPYVSEFKTNTELQRFAKTDSDMYKHTIKNFKEIIKFKKDNPDNVILLIGNHDCTYAVSPNICNCRADIIGFGKIRKLFKNNKELFQLAYYAKSGDRECILSHAGLHKAFAEYRFGKEISELPIEEIVNKFNESWKNDSDNVLEYLGLCSYYRGGYDDFGSIVWADVHEWATLFPKDEYDVFQIFGHTQLLNHTMVSNKFANLDCRKAFRLKDGMILSLDGIPENVLADK